VEGGFDARAVVVSYRADAMEDVVDVLLFDRRGSERYFAVNVPSFWWPTEVQHHLQQFADSGLLVEADAHMLRERTEENIEIVSDDIVKERIAHGQSFITLEGMR